MQHLSRLCRKSMLVAVVFFAVISLAGCSSESKQEMKSYGHDGYMGFSNSNPNTVNRHSSLSYQRDVELIRQVLMPLQGIHRTDISFNGNDVHVTVVAKNSMNREQIKQLKAKVQAIVQENLPLYDVHVKVAKG
ncbi:hypothetical protein M6D81_18490 [Paenibacillus sp. J5C_2022]|uniref:hypothetical protein n=1 Tax=Paenibacillus sp. J5C2022 TaxID=2977129 RepID=UPI0021CF399D|nr:hypothetical protein [Paenibacillus sp. J5C2022]MCU6710682.1 hypothetical protein [Paenibacillus sp. J5C2022]